MVSAAGAATRSHRKQKLATSADYTNDMSTRKSFQPELPVIIIGAGVSGLTLAQACRKEHIPCRVFERDELATQRSAGWGPTVYWALPAFKALILDELATRLSECYVDQAAIEAGEKGSFTFFDLGTAEPRVQVPAAERIRVSREKLRTLLLTNLNVQRSKTLTNIEVANGTVKATFSDGTSETGSMLIGCDGANSTVRRIIHPKEDHQPTQDLPIRLLSATANYSSSQISTIRNLAPFGFRGTDPKTDVFLSFIFLETPSHKSSNNRPDPSSAKDDTYKCRLTTSWPYRPNWLGRVDPTDCPNTKTGQRALMRHLSAAWAEPFRSLVQDMPREAEIRPVELADWLPRKSNGFEGRVVLLGDAARSVGWCGGEGAGCAVADVSRLMEVLRGIGEGEGFEAARERYEREMVERTELAGCSGLLGCA